MVSAAKYENICFHYDSTDMKHNNRMSVLFNDFIGFIAEMMFILHIQLSQMLGETL